MGKMVLTVDDSPSIRQMVSFTLKGAGYEVTEATDGKDGLTLVKSLRALPQYASVPIQMLTTESSDQMKSQGRAAGATGWLVKPFDPQKLLEVVRKVIG